MLAGGVWIESKNYHGTRRLGVAAGNVLNKQHCVQDPTEVDSGRQACLLPPDLGLFASNSVPTPKTGHLPGGAGTPFLAL